MDELVVKLKDLNLKRYIKWNNKFNSKINLDKEIYTRDEVINILNCYDIELNNKFIDYITSQEEIVKLQQYKLYSLSLNESV